MFVKNYTTGKCYSYGKEVTAEEYTEITDRLKNPPDAPDGYYYTLNEELEWELREVPAVEEELTETEQKAKAYDILMGVSE